MKTTAMKRVLSLLLVFALMLSVMPFALAADPEPKDPVEDTKIGDMSITITAMGSYPLKSLFTLSPTVPFYYTVNRGTNTEQRRQYTSFTLETLSFSIPSGYQLTLNGQPFEQNGSATSFTFTTDQDLEGYLNNLSLKAGPGASGNTSFTYSLSGKAEYVVLDNQNKPVIPEGEKTAEVIKDDAFSFPYNPTVKISTKETSIAQFDVEMVEDKKDENGNVISYTAQITAADFTAALKSAFPEYPDVKIDHLTGIDFLASTDGAVVNSAGNAIGPNTTVTMGDGDYITFLSPENSTKTSYVVSYHAVAKVNGGDVSYNGTFRLHAQFPTKGNVPEFTRTINSSDKSVVFSIDDIATAAKAIRTAENLKSVKIEKVTFSFDSSDMTLNFANSSAVESGKEYEVINSSTIQVVSKKPTSDVRLFYVAVGDDGFTYSGSIVIKGVSGEQVNVSDISKQISGSTLGASMTISEISAKAGNKNIVGITFTYSTADVTLKLGNETVESGKSYVVVNSSALNATSRKPTSDVRVLYEATAEDGTIYKGYIVYLKLQSQNIELVSGAYSVYIPGASFLGYYDASAFIAKVKNDAISKFEITDAQFTYVAAVDSKGTATYNTADIFDLDKGWQNSSSFGYIATTSSASSSKGVTSFTAYDRVYYVPGQTAGTVTISYTAYGSKTLYTGTVSYTVYSIKNGVSVTLELKSRDPYTFSEPDKEKVVFGDTIQALIKEAFGDKAVCNYVLFDKVQASAGNYGTLFTDANRTPLSTTVGYYFKNAIPSVATAPVSGLYYVPTTTAGKYTVNYSVFITFDGTEYELPGTLTISTPGDTLINPDILYQVTTNTRVSFSADDFKTYLQNIRSAYTFEYVRFTAMPSTGSLYYGTTAVTKDTLPNYTFYESTANSHASIGSLSYFPAGTNYYVTIPFTVFYRQTATNSALSSRDGQVVIVVTSVQVSEINYQIKSGDSAWMKTEDFSRVCEAATGNTLDHVYFNISSVVGGRLSYSTGTASINGTTTYYLASNRTPNLANIKFTPTATTGTLTFMYSAYTSGGTYLYSGRVNVKLFSETRTPAHKSCVLSAQKMVCNGQEVSLQAYNIDGYNYLKLRDIAALMAGTGSKFSIQVTDTALKREVSCTLGGTYLLAADDLKTGADQSKTCVASSWSFYVNGEYKSVYVYNIGGYNYFKLRDLGDALKFGVDYNAVTNTAIITSSDYRG